MEKSRKTAIVLVALACWTAPAIPAQTGNPLGQALEPQAKLEREHIADLVRSGGNVIQSQQGEDLTLVSTYENFVVNMPTGTSQVRGVVARVIDRSGDHVAELLLVEPAEVVLWKLYGEDRSAGPLEVASFPLREVAPEVRASEANPIRALSWAHDMLLDLWRNGPTAERWQGKDLGLTDLDLKDTVGCTGLAWLNNSTLRPCCDDHDLCYATNECTAASWNPFNSTWECFGCNATVVACFAISYWLNQGIFWHWCWGPNCCDDGLPCIIIECT